MSPGGLTKLLETTERYEPAIGVRANPHGCGKANATIKSSVAWASDLTEGAHVPGASSSDHHVLLAVLSLIRNRCRDRAVFELGRRHQLACSRSNGACPRMKSCGRSN